MTSAERAAPARVVYLNPDAPEEDDDALVLRAGQGDAEAFGRLVRRHQAAVLRIASRYASGRGEAADIAQNTLLALYRYLPRYRAKGHFRAFLFRLTLNQCRAERRATTRALRKIQALAARPQVVAPDPLLDAIRADAVQRALGTLSEKLRSVVVLRYSGELAYEEIAEALDIPIGTVRSRLNAALEKLGRAVEREE